jgi:hypothetical protein
MCRRNELSTGVFCVWVPPVVLHGGTQRVLAVAHAHRHPCGVSSCLYGQDVGHVCACTCGCLSAPIWGSGCARTVWPCRQHVPPEIPGGDLSINHRTCKSTACNLSQWLWTYFGNEPLHQLQYSCPLQCTKSVRREHRKYFTYMM